jgi:hypothetical protein
MGDSFLQSHSSSSIAFAGQSRTSRANVGHAAAVIWLLLIDACLSIIADDKLDEVIQYFWL